MSTSTTVWYNDYTIYNELLRLSRLHKFNQFTFEYLMKYAVKGSQVILDEIELLNSAEVEDDEKELITKKMLIVLKSYKHQCHDAASLCSLAPSLAEADKRRRSRSAERGRSFRLPRTCPITCSKRV